MKTKAVFFQLHKKREDFFLLILNSHINKRIEGGFRDRSKAAQCSYPSQISPRGSEWKVQDETAKTGISDIYFSIQGRRFE